MWTYGLPFSPDFSTVGFLGRCPLGTSLSLSNCSLDISSVGGSGEEGLVDAGLGEGVVDGAAKCIPLPSDDWLRPTPACFWALWKRKI